MICVLTALKGREHNTKIADANNDTKVQVEEGDDDIIIYGHISRIALEIGD